MRRSIRGVAAALALGLLSCGPNELMRVDGELVASPLAIDFGPVAVHGQQAQKVMLRNAGRAPLVLDAVDASADVATQALTSGAAPTFLAAPKHAMPMTLTTDNGTSVEVSFEPTVAGTLKGELHITTDASMVTIPLRGEAIDTSAAIGPEQLDFGKIEIGTEAMLALTVNNTSSLDIVVTPTGVGANADEFTSGPLTVPARQTRLLPVTFSPTRQGRVGSGLAVTRCAGCATTQVQLYGEGIESSLVVDPDPMDFGSVPVDASVEVDCRLINVSSLPIELRGVSLDPASDTDFHLLQTVPDMILPPGGWLATGIRYTPSHLGDASGALLADSSSHRHPTLSVPLVGRGGGAEIAVEPLSIDFGDVPVGGEGDSVIHIRNAGSGSDVLSVSSVDLAGATTFALGSTQFPLSLSAGQSVDVGVSFVPSTPGAAAGTVTVNSSDGSSPHVVVPLTANGRQVAPCVFQLAPLAIDFGNVPPGTGAVLGLRFTNLGADLCAVRDVQIDQDAAGAFFMPGGALPSLLLYSGDAFETQVAFRPNVPGRVTGNLTMQVSDPASPTVNLPLLGNSAAACLSAAPPFIDFGPLRRDCTHASRSTHLVNACSAPLTINQIWIGAGTSLEFSLLNTPAMPLPLVPGAGFTLSVAYAGQEVGQNFSPLYFAESDVPGSPLLVPLLGEGLPDGNVTDHFVQADGTKADVLFIVDNSASMIEEQPRLQAAIPAFILSAQTLGMDLHVGVTTTGIDPVTDPGCNGGAQGGEAGRLFPVDNSAPRIIDLTHSTPAQEIQNNVNVGLCHHLEQGLEATRRALSTPLVDHADDPATPAPNDGNLGFLRDDAQLSVVVVSDEDDHSGDDVADYASFLLSVHGLSQPQRAGFFALAPLSSCATSSASSAPRYSQMALATHGETWDVCEHDYGPALASIAQRSFGPQNRFPLTQLADPTSITVSFNGAPAAAGSWSYDSTANAIVLSPAPAPGTAIDVSYKALCPP